MQGGYFSNILRSKSRYPGNLGLVQRRATGVCAHQREILGWGVVYFILIVNDRAYTQIIIGECAVRSFYRSNSFVANEKKSIVDFGLIINQAGVTRCIDCAPLAFPVVRGPSLSSASSSVLWNSYLLPSEELVYNT